MVRLLQGYSKGIVSTIFNYGSLTINDGEFLQSDTKISTLYGYPQVVYTDKDTETNSTPSTTIVGGTFKNSHTNKTAWTIRSTNAATATTKVTGGKFNKTVFSSYIEGGYASTTTKVDGYYQVATAITSVTLDKTELTLKAGLSETLTATVAPSDAEVQTVTWTSSDKTVATVSTSGKITGVKNGTAIITATPAGSETGVKCTVTVTMGDAAVGEKQYATLQAAIQGASNGKIVTLLTDVTEDVSISAKKKLTLDLNNHTITNASGDTITVASGATLTITGKGTVDNVTNGKAALVNNGTVTLNGGTYTRSLENRENNKDNGGGNSYYTILNDKGGSLTINDGVSVTNVGHFSSMIRNGGDENSNAQSTLTINGGTFSGGINTVKNDECGVLTITGGDFSNTSQYVVMNWNKAEISGGTFEANESAEAVLFSVSYLENRAVGELTITGGTFKGANGQAMIDNHYETNYTGSAAVSGGTFTGDVSGFVVEGCGLQKDTAGNYTVVKASDAVLEILDENGAVKYYVTETKTKGMKWAIAAAEDGYTIKLLQDVSGYNVDFTFDKAITLDLNGHTFTNRVTASEGEIYAFTNTAPVTVLNGTIETISSATRVWNASADLTMKDVHIIGVGLVGVALGAAGGTYSFENTTIEGGYALANFANNATISVSNSTLKGTSCGLYHNGTNYGLKLNVVNTSIVAGSGERNDTEKTTGVYISGSIDAQSNDANQNGKGGKHQVSFEDCTIKGSTAVEVKYVDLTLEDCTVEATYSGEPTYAQYNNGSTTLGFAVVSSDNTLEPTEPQPEGTIAIKGQNGSYTGLIGLSSFADMATKYPDMKEATYAITGGAFSTDVSAYTAAGFGCYQNAVSDGLYRVGVKQDVSSKEIKGKDDTEQTVIDTALDSIGKNTAANNFAGHGADEVEVSEEVKTDLTNQGAAIDEDTTIITTISVKTTAMEVKNEAVTEVTYEVTPIAKVTVGETTYTAEIKNPGQTLTFRLPIPFNNATTVKVSHNGNYFGTYNVLGEAATGRYIELSSDTFSPWTVENASGYEDNDIVAETTTQKFTSLAAALNAAENGDTVTVLRNCELNEQVAIADGRTITLDLGGFTVTTAEHYVMQIEHGNLTVKNGTIEATKEDGLTVFSVVGAVTDEGANYSVLTLDGVTVNAPKIWYTAVIVPYGGTSGHSYGAVVNVTNHSRLTAKANLYVNGQMQDLDGNYPKFNVSDSVITATDGIAVYAAGFTDWTVTNSTITGDTGIYAKAGTFEITDSTITGNGEYYEPQAFGNGAYSTGDAIVMDSNTGYAGHMTLALTGSTVTSVNGSAVHEALTDATESSTQTVTISGGEFTAAPGKETIKTSEAFDRSDNTELQVIGTPTGVTAQDKIGQFTEFSLTYGDGLPYGNFSNFLNSNGGDAGTVNYPACKTSDQNLTVYFKVTMGTVSYKTGDMTEFKTIQSNGEIPEAVNDTPITFQIECGNTVTNTFTVTPHWESISENYTLTVKAPDNVNLEAEKTYTFDVVVSSTSANPTAVGSYDFTLNYPTEYFEFVSYSVTGAEVNSATNGSVKIGAALENGITPTTEGATLGTVTLKAKFDHVDNADEITIKVTDPVVTPKGYDKNAGEITAVDHVQYYINFKYIGCTNTDYSQWFTKGTDVTAKKPEPKTGWSEGTWSPALGKATGPETYTYTANHIQYTVTWDEANNPMNVTKTTKFGADGVTEGTETTTELTNGGKMYYEDRLTVTVDAKDLGAKTVIRNGGFKYTIDGTSTGVDRNGTSGYEYTVGPKVNGDVTLSYVTTEYVEITFDGNNVATLDDTDDTFTAITRKGVADALYTNEAEFIANSNTFVIPTQKAKDGYRLVPPEANLAQEDQQWKIGDTTDTVTNAVLKGTPAYTQSFNADTTLTPVVVAVYEVKFVAGTNGRIKATNPEQQTVWHVDADTNIEDIINDRAVDNLLGKVTITRPQLTPNEGYKFKEWNPNTGKVTGNTTITANFEQAWYNFSLSDNSAQYTQVSGFKNGLVSWSDDVTFKLNPKTGTRITKVTYTVAANANGTEFAGKNDIEIEAVDGVYTIPKDVILGDVTVTVETADTVKITIGTGANANGIIGGTTVFTVDKGKGLPENMSALTMTPDAGYEWDEKFYTDAACETELASNATFDKDTTLYVKFVDAEYNFTADAGVSVTEGVTNGKAKHGDEIKFTVDSKQTGLISKVGYTVGNGAERELTPDANGNYTIPGSAITGDIKVTVTTLAKEAGLTNAKLTVSFILRDSTQTGVEGDGGYMANVLQNTDMKIMLLSDAKNTDIRGKFFRLDNGTQMYWSSKYNAYVCWVPADTTAAGMNGRISYVDGKDPLAIAYNGDLNFDGKTNSADAGIVNDALLNARVVPTSALQLFEMDVNGNKTVSADDVTWILQKTVGLLN